jgi:hypothetical protein
MKEMQDWKTGCEWATEKGIRISNIGKWNQSSDKTIFRPIHECERHYCLEPISEQEFNMNIEQVGVELPTSFYSPIPYKPDWFLELRMYSLVPYNIMGIQKGIQHEHSVTDYVKNYVIQSDVKDDLFVKWAKEWKTTIILNGGTSNEGHMVRHGFRNITYVGSMQQHLKALKDNGVKVSTFDEPDLNSMLTATSFIVDERVFNRRSYPDYVPIEFYIDSELNKWEVEEAENRAEWLELIGGEKNAFLRDFLKDFRLA